MGSHARDRSRVVAGSLGLLVRRVVRLVDDDQAEARKGREDGRSRSHHRVHLSTARPLPGGRPFPVGETAVEERDALSEAGDDAPDEPRRECDLRDEQNSLPAESDRRLERGKVDLRLPASRHAVEEEPGLDAPGKRRPDGFDGVLLRCGRDDREDRPGREGVSGGVGGALFLDDRDETVLHEGRQNRGSRPGGAKLGGRSRPAERGQVGEGTSLFRFARETRVAGGTSRDPALREGRPGSPHLLRRDPDEPLVQKRAERPRETAASEPFGELDLRGPPGLHEDRQDFRAPAIPRLGSDRPARRDI